jgi:NHL repeat/WD40-like Beta Propeller Repeat
MLVARDRRLTCPDTRHPYQRGIHVTKAHRALVWPVVLGAFIVLGAAPTLAFRGHEFSYTFGGASSSVVDPQPLLAPSGVAVNEATGQVYVLDQGNSRVERFSSAGAYEGQLNGPSASGTGTLESASNKIKSVTTATGAFTVGEELSAPGLPTGATITAVIGGETPELEVSQPATSSQSASLSAHQAFAFSTTALNDGIAVDNSCYFHKTTETSKPTCNESDPSNGDLYVTSPDNGVVDKFNSAGEYLGQLQQACGKADCPPFIFEDVVHRQEARALAGVSVDTSGSVWVYTDNPHTDGDADQFTNTEPSLLESIKQLAYTHEAPFTAPGFAVDSEDNLYVRGFEPSVFSKFSNSGKQLLAPFSAEEATAVAVDLSSDEVFLDNRAFAGAFSPSGVLEERFDSGHLSSAGGLAVSHENANRADTTVYVADSGANVVDVFPPELPGPPKVIGESVTKVTADSATLEGEVNPHGANTEYHFEYGPCVTPATCATSAYEKSVPVPDRFVGADFEVHDVSANPQELLAGTLYHFRMVAHNEINGVLRTVAGESQTFTTQTTGGELELPDGRQWEMVSQPNKLGALIEPIGGFGPVQASGNGDAITYVTTSPTETGPQGYAVRVQVLSTRGPSGWGSHDITIPHPLATGPSVGQGVEYRFSSEDLSHSLLQPFGGFDQSLSAEAFEQTPYLHTNYLNGNVSEPCLPATPGCYRPLVTAENATSGDPFGEEGECTPIQGKLICGPVLLGATPDLSHVVLHSEVPLTSTSGDNGGLYEWDGGGLKFVGNGSLGYADQSARHAISDDGSRVVFSQGGAGGHLFMRDTVKGQTVQLDAVEEGTGSNEAKPVFQDASSDGSRVFFTDSQQLTKDSGAQSSQPDLYECQISEGETGDPQCDLFDLTPESFGEPADVLGAVLGASEDGSYVYFVANGAQDTGPGVVHHGKCAGIGTAGATCNLYVRHNAITRLIAVLSGEDLPDWADGQPEAIDKLTARVSPDGRWLTFMSQRSLTGYDNHDATSGKPDEELYLYDAASERLVCVSCNPTGARPAGVEVGNQERIVDSAGASKPDWPTTAWLAASIPGWTPYDSELSRYQSRYLSDSGRLFFNSNDALVPQDVNGTWDVYQYEPPGVGGCTVSAATFSERSDGCVGLISSGESPDESAFLDASASGGRDSEGHEGGGDVFFLTTAKLATKDFDTALDIYDAHECTGASPCLPAPIQTAPECVTADGCRAAPTPQPSIFGAPSSATFSGVGNIAPPPFATVKPKALTRAQKLTKMLRACRTKYRRSAKRRAACEHAASRKYGNGRSETTKRSVKG